MFLATIFIFIVIFLLDFKFTEFSKQTSIEIQETRITTQKINYQALPINRRLQKILKKNNRHLDLPLDVKNFYQPKIILGILSANSNFIERNYQRRTFLKTIIQKYLVEHFTYKFLIDKPCTAFGNGQLFRDG